MERAADIHVRTLANLARIEITDAEARSLEKELPAIVAFVDDIQQAVASAPAAVPALRNVMRDDSSARACGEYTERLIAAAPASKDGYVKVKQVLSRNT